MKQPKVKEISNIILAELYRYISDYYESAVADYVMDIMGFEKAELTVAIKARSYSFNIEEMLDILDVPFKKENGAYLIYDKVIALEREPNKAGGSVQVVPDDLYLKDIFLSKNTTLNSTCLQLRVKWDHIGL